jgi:Flp pilus assembly protein TadB
MSPSSSQPWTRLIRPGANDYMRVSDAERAEVADRLATHYSDGRLDKAEFDERVARAMSAKTRGDLNGLFDDLPDAGAGYDSTAAGRGGAGGGTGGVYGPTRPYGMNRRGRHGHPVAVIAVAVIAMFILWHAFLHIFFIPWFAIIVLIGAVVFANRASHRARRDRQ